MEWCYLRFLKYAHQLGKLDIEALSQKKAAHTGICNNWIKVSIVAWRIWKAMSI